VILLFPMLICPDRVPPELPSLFVKLKKSEAETYPGDTLEAWEIEIWGVVVELMTLRGVPEGGVPEGTATTEVTAPEAGVDETQFVPLYCSTCPEAGVPEIAIPFKWLSS
jgi:hypothetical protein